MFGAAKIRDAPHRFGQNNHTKRRLVAERPASELRKEAERTQAEREKEEESQDYNFS
jgi:hypothetical protein